MATNGNAEIEANASAESAGAPDHVDVLIIGAGLSGIGAACHLRRECPGKTFALLESRDAVGGTWDLFRYPGIRSDSDMYTLGYSFKPWTNPKAIADGPSILSYVRETAREYDVERHIRFNHRVVRAEWSSDDAQWTVTAIRTAPRDPGADTTNDDGAEIQITASFIMSCTGYYSYENPYSPEFPGAERFGGPIIHPQHWPEDLDYEGKRVVVIGSGATAVTLVPAMAQKAAHVTMLQRSPTYVIARPAEDGIANFAKRHLPAKAAYTVARWKGVGLTMLSFNLARKRPNLVKRALRKAQEKQLPADFDIDTHFTPSYNPWDQRLCLVPDGDLFRSLRHGEASIVTDTIESFDETGIQLSSGEHLDADVIVTATGLNLVALGSVKLAVDGEPIEIPRTLGYKGMMLSGVPNLAAAIGYTNASWTLKCDLTCEYVCRLINHMDARGYDSCTPMNDDPTVEEQPFIDFNSGYVLRAIESFPKQGSKKPWRLNQNYFKDLRELRRDELEDGAMRFERAGTPVASGASHTPAAAVASPPA